MIFLRRITKFIALLAWLPVIGLISLPFTIGGWKSIRMVSFCARIWGRGIARIIRLRVKYLGDTSPFHGGLIVANHQGYLDIIAHSTIFPLRFTPKIQIRKWPILGCYLGVSRPIWIDRSSKQKSLQLVKDFIATMKHDINLIVYPEGTSTSGRGGILPFKSPPFAAIASTNLPIKPAVTVFSVPGKDDNVAWYADMTLVPHVWKILGYKQIDVEVHALPLVYPEGRTRKELAAYVHDLMEKKYWEIMEEKGLERVAPEDAANQIRK